MMQPTETFINAQLLSDGKFYNKIVIKYNKTTQMYTLFADGVFKAESVDADNLRTMIGESLQGKQFFCVVTKFDRYDDATSYYIEEVHPVLTHDNMCLRYRIADDNEEERMVHVDNIGCGLFTNEHKAVEYLINKCQEQLKFATACRDEAQKRVDSLTKCLQYYEGENK